MLRFPPRRQFPPRRDLPPGVVIPRLPGVGASWYERGFSYWARRAWVLVVLSAAVAIYYALISAVIQKAGPAGSPGFLAALAGEVVFTLVTGAWTFRMLWRAGFSGRVSTASRGRRATGPGLGLLAASAGGVVGGALIALGGLLTSGFIVGAVVIWLLPVLPAEQHAREQLAEALRPRQGTHHAHPPAAQRSKHWGSH